MKRKFLIILITFLITFSVCLFFTYLMRMDVGLNKVFGRDVATSTFISNYSLPSPIIGVSMRSGPMTGIFPVPSGEQPNINTNAVTVYNPPIQPQRDVASGTPEEEAEARLKLGIKKEYIDLCLSMKDKFETLETNMKNNNNKEYYYNLNTKYSIAYLAGYTGRMYPYFLASYNENLKNKMDPINYCERSEQSKSVLYKYQDGKYIEIDDMKNILENVGLTNNYMYVTAWNDNIVYFMTDYYLAQVKLIAYDIINKKPLDLKEVYPIVCGKEGCPMTNSSRFAIMLSSSDYNSNKYLYDFSTSKKYKLDIESDNNYSYELIGNNSRVDMIRYLKNGKYIYLYIDDILNWESESIFK